MQLYERYRPRTWADVVGQDKAIAKVRTLAGRGLGGRAFFVSGKSGQGKTTIARLIAAEVADDWFVEEIDASDLTPARLRDYEASMSLCAAGKGGRAYIVNEAHGLRKDTIRQLLVLLERLPRHVVIVFTTTLDGANLLFEDCADASPLLSRCIEIQLAQRDLAKAFAARAQAIAQAEGLDGQPLEAYLRLVNKHGGNMRAVLQAIESGAMLA